MLTFCINVRGKAEAQKGCHDDTVLALTLAVIVLTRMPKPIAVRGDMPRPEVRKYGQPQTGNERGRVVRVR